jgi:hypothetical protein
MDKRSSLLQKFVIFERKKFYTIGPSSQYYTKGFLIIDEQAKKSSVFVLGKPFQPSPIFSIQV